ncbi:MAG: iron complex outerrane recepter protein [Verrucomicrobiota bacterium]|jgi:iron complex outermembrane receptor protein
MRAYPTLAPFKTSLAFLLLVSTINARSEATNVLHSAEEMKKLTLEELANVKVYSVSRRPEAASQAAAAVEVITQEQIERSGAASVPDALRLATGVQVSRFGGHSFALSSRGFSSLAANKLQVMQDGRSLYSPLFSGVFWDAYDTLLDDVDRIEVIRGPGAAMWGANAVNGVINIISKDARDTQGTLVKAGGGTEERGFGAIRYGGKIAEETFFRVYGQYWNRDAMAYPSGQAGHDVSQEGLGGFRMDSKLDNDDHVTVQGDLFHNEFDLVSRRDALNTDGNLLSRWSRQLAGGSELQLQMYYDRFQRNVPGQFGETRNTYDGDMQYRFQLGDRHSFVAGVGYRLSEDQTKRGGTLEFSPRERTIHIVSAFAQDEIALVPKQLSLVLGSKFEYDSLDGFEPQPTVRLAWTPTDRQTIWGAVSRAIRMPSRIDEDLRFIPVPATGTVFVRGNPDFEPEVVLAYEMGYRIQPVTNVSVDLAGYYNRYDGLRSLEPTPPVGIPLEQQNLLDAETYGAEVSLKFQATFWWRLSGNYTYLHKNLLPRSNSRDPNQGALEGNDAPHLFSIWSSMDLPARVNLDCIVRYVDALPNPRVPSYITVDVRAAWRPVPNLELAVVGQNLAAKQHREFGAPTATTAEVERGVYGKLTWRF